MNVPSTPISSKKSSSYHIAVLLGGESAEREISLKSGTAVAAALRQSGHNVFEIDPALVPLEQQDFRQFDVVFIALHGEYGEDGLVQRLLEMKRVPFTGSNSRASSLAFHKIAAKKQFFKSGIPTPAFECVTPSMTATEIAALVRCIDYPLVVKPECQGSSIGVSLVNQPEELAHAMNVAFHHSEQVLLEAAVLGDEWTVTVFNETVFEPLQIIDHREKSDGIFDFELKYKNTHAKHRFAEGNATENQIAESGSSGASSLNTLLKETASNACNALGTSGLSRVDLRLDKHGRPWVLEINTVPGLTSSSLAPQAAAQAGHSFEDLCNIMVESAIVNFTKSNQRKSA